LILQKPYIIHVHGNHLGNEYASLKGIKNWIFSYFIKKASAGIVLSQSLRINFTGLLHHDKVFIVENFAQDDLMQKKNIPKPKDILRLLYLGNLMVQKGILDFLESLILLKKEGILFTADIAGKIEDEMEFIILNKFKELQGFIKYHGVVYGQAKIDLFVNSNVFVLPTYFLMEGQPISLLEAMATGNIIITTNFSGIPDIITTDNGYFVLPQNPQNIFDAFNNINKNLKKNILKFSKTNINYVKSNFTEDSFTDKIFKIIKQVYEVK
jgi:glycosyltransferase involved in cell wall biosynthesis